MRRIIIASLMLSITAVVVSMAASASGSSKLGLSVKPRVGHPRTKFEVSFTAPARTGRSGLSLTWYSVLAQASCGKTVSTRVPATRKGERVHVMLSAKRRWCAGMVKGQLLETFGFVCPGICAGPAVRVKTLARFTFRVVAAAPDTSPPSFAGLKSAFACTPGPQRPGQTTPFNLSWSAASDDQTPSSQIVYDVFYSTTPGGEDFSHPNWTTSPGVTTFRTPGLASHGLFYFVVRARDQAGNEDQNRVERRGIDPCL
jgi:hypothetical protein